jgi:hypothetical protein
VNPSDPPEYGDVHARERGERKHKRLRGLLLRARHDNRGF